MRGSDPPAQRRLYRQLTTPLSEDQKNKVEALLNAREGSRQTVLAWLRQPAGERLQALHQVGLPDEIGRTVHQNHLLRLARERAQTTVYHLKDFEVERRQATLVAIDRSDFMPTLYHAQVGPLET